MKTMLKTMIISMLAVATLALGGAAWAQNDVDARPVPDTAADIQPLLIGSIIPDIQLKTVSGESVHLKERLEKRPAVLIFYRGGWCPYCNMQLGQLKTVEPMLVDLGYELLAISPDSPEKLRISIQKQDLTYTLLSDHSMAAARALGIAFRVDDETVEKYHGYGIDLEEASGESHQMLPVPSVFILDREGVVRFVYANPDYKERIDPDVLVAAAKAALDD